MFDQNILEHTMLSLLHNKSQFQDASYTKKNLNRIAEKLENKERWKFIQDNLEEIVKNDCIKNDTLLKVLLTFKSVFNQTPISLKIGTNKANAYYREVALYVLTNYSNASLEEIARHFKMPIDTLENYKNNRHYEKRYKKPLEKYFKSKILSFAYNRDCLIGFWSILSEEKFEELSNSIIKIVEEAKQ